MNVLPDSGFIQAVHHGKRTSEEADSFVATIKANSDGDAPLFLSDGWELTLKPHPANQIKVENYPDLNIRLTKKPLEKLLANFKIAISSVCTSASIEVFLSGLNVITILDDDDFNSSALRGIQGATFVSTKEELKDALISWHIKPYIIEKNTFFWTDPDLKKWKNALNLN